MPSGRYLLESGAPDGYLLEDGSGVYLLDPGLALASGVANIRTLAPDPSTWSHTIPADCVGFAVLIVNVQTATDHIVSVTVGGVALARQVRATDTAIEPGSADWWFVGSGIPTGVQTVSVDFSSATVDDMWLVSLAIIGDRNTEVVTTGALNEDQIDPSLTINLGGRTALTLVGIFSGHGKVTDLTDRPDNIRYLSQWDIGGVSYGAAISQTVLRSTDPTVGYFSVSGFQDDCAMVAMAIAEVPLGQPITRRRGGIPFQANRPAIGRGW